MAYSVGTAKAKSRKVPGQLGRRVHRRVRGRLSARRLLGLVRRLAGHSASTQVTSFSIVSACKGVDVSDGFTVHTCRELESNMLPGAAVRLQKVYRLRR